MYALVAAEKKAYSLGGGGRLKRTTRSARGAYIIRRGLTGAVSPKTPTTRIRQLGSNKKKRGSLARAITVRSV